MRSEPEILKLILDFARENPAVRAVVQNGSRVNPRVIPDEFADYDVVFVVADPEAFKRDGSWRRRFGETLIVQQNDSDEPGVKWVVFLMLFAWHIGLRHDWKVDPGYFGKRFHQYLPPDMWRAVERSYAGSDDGDIWRSIFESGKLVRRIGLELAGKLEYHYPLDEDEKVTRYLLDVKNRSRK